MLLVFFFFFFADAPVCSYRKECACVNVGFAWMCKQDVETFATCAIGTHLFAPATRSNNKCNTLKWRKIALNNIFSIEQNYKIFFILLINCYCYAIYLPFCSGCGSGCISSLATECLFLSNGVVQCFDIAAPLSRTMCSKVKINEFNST